MSDDIAALNGGQPVRTDEENTGGRDFEPLPAGWYPVECNKSVLKDTQDKKGKYLWLEVTVLGDRYANRKLFPKFNLVNNSAEAVKIGQRDLGFLGQAVGMPTGVKASAELIGKQFDVRVKIRPARGDYPADNEVTAYDVLGKMSSKTPAQAPGPKAAGKTAPAPAKRAWDKPPEGNAPASPVGAVASAASSTTPASAPTASTTPPSPAAAGAPPPAPAAPVARAARPWERK